MREHRSSHRAPMPWRFTIAVEDIAETGQRFDLTADAEIRAALAQMAGLRDLPRLQANFEVIRHGRGGLRVTGLVSATVEQTCVVTLEALTNNIVEQVDLLFLPTPGSAPKRREPEAFDQAWDEPEPLIGGKLDLGALATEFLMLGLDPYPRKNGAVFQPPQHAKPDEGPFAALAALKKAALDR